MDQCHKAPTLGPENHTSRGLYGFPACLQKQERPLVAAGQPMLGQTRWALSSLAVLFGGKESFQPPLLRNGLRVFSDGSVRCLWL